MSTSMSVRRAVAAVAGGAVVAGALTALAPAPAAHAAPVNAEAVAAAGWLANQLDENGRFTTGFDAVGSTIDFGLSLVATDADPAALAEVASGIKEVLATYIGTEEAPNASKLAKAAGFFEATGADLTNVDGVDLKTRLEAVVDGATGQLGSFPDVYGQVWAVSVLDAEGSAEAPKATEYLIDQQCDGGAWGYDDWNTGACVSVVDGTAYTLLALLPQQGDPAVDQAIDDAVGWLKSQQRADGGFGDWGVNSDGSTSEGNGSGLAAWALGSAGELEAAAKAAAWVADHQLVGIADCGAGPVAGESGALAYDEHDIETAVVKGITPAARGSWVFTGAQALAGLTFLDERAATMATIAGPTGYVSGGAKTSFKVTGLRPGQTACVTGFGPTAWVVGSKEHQLQAPADTQIFTVTIRFGTGSASVNAKVLGATTLQVKVPAKVEAKKKAAVKVKGLTPGESVTVKLGRKSATGTADANGVAKVKVKVKVKKLGRAKVTVVGQFPDRKGKAKTRVV